MKLANVFVWCLVVSSAYAQPLLLNDAPKALEESRLREPQRQARLLKETLTVAGVGVLVPMTTYLAITQTGKSFQSFFTGFAVSTAVGLLVAPLAVSLLHGHWGGKGNAGRALLGALIGVAVGALVGLPLATLPNDGYHVGLGLLWALPATATLVALEWG